MVVDDDETTEVVIDVGPTVVVTDVEVVTGHWPDVQSHTEQVPEDGPLEVPDSQVLVLAHQPQPLTAAQPMQLLNEPQLMMVVVETVEAAVVVVTVEQPMQIVVVLTDVEVVTGH